MAPTMKHLIASLRPRSPLQLSYLDQPSSPNAPHKGTILLLHGFPQTSYQFRHVIPTLAAAGYRTLAPDYRGAGHSSKPLDSDFRKTTLATDIIHLLDNLQITEPIHLVGHDIGGMVAYTLASRYPKRFRSVNWGECPLPGTGKYRESRTVTEETVKYFHFIFHAVPDLPEALVAGKEKVYVQHFLSKISHNLAAFSEKDVEYYANSYAQPGAMRCAMCVYREFERDAEENIAWGREEGKCKVPTMILSGEHSPVRFGAEQMAKEVTEELVEVGVVEGAGHYLAEENPDGFAKIVLEFVGKH